jgi:hypothetical protein
MNKHNQEIPVRRVRTKEEHEAEYHRLVDIFAKSDALRKLRTQRNRLIYSHLGWRKEKRYRYHGYVWNSPCGLRAMFQSALPDHFKDLNAIHAAWASTIQGNGELEDRYAIELLREVGAEKPDWSLASNATAEQRTEALGRTLGIW